MAASYLKAYMVRNNGICDPQTRGVNEVGGWPATSVVYFPRVLQEVKRPMPGCPEVAYIVGRLRKHFMYSHFRPKV